MECEVCGTTDFSLQNGFYFCEECGTQSQEMREQVFENEGEIGPGVTRELRKKATKNGSKKGIDKGKPWVSLEGFQCILKAVVESLISFGVSKSLKEVVWSIWTQFLKKSNIAFTGKRQMKGRLLAPLAILALRDRLVGTSDDPLPYRKRSNCADKDVIDSPEVSAVEDEDEDLSEENDTIEGEKETVNTSISKTKSRLQSTKQNNNVDSDSNSESDEDSRRPTLRGDFARPVKQDFILVIVYLGLRWLNEPITANDLARWVREGHIPYHKASEILPEHMKFSGSDALVLCGRHSVKPLRITAKAVRTIGFLDLPAFPKPDIDVLKARLIVDLDLPDVFHKLVTAFMEVIKYDPVFAVADTRMTCFMRRSHFFDEMIATFVIIIMKLLYFLDEESERFGLLRRQMVAIAGEDMEPYYVWARRMFMREKHRLANGVPENEEDLIYLQTLERYSAYCATNVFSSYQPRMTVPRKNTENRYFKACLTDRRERYHDFFTSLLPGFAEAKEEMCNEALPLTSFPLTFEKNKQTEFGAGNSDAAEEASDTRFSKTRDWDIYWRYLRTSRKRDFPESYSFLLHVCARRLELSEEELQLFVDEVEHFLFVKNLFRKPRRSQAVGRFKR